MRSKWCLPCFFLVGLLLTIGALKPAASPPSSDPPNSLENAFQVGWAVVNTNGDGVADALRGHVVVPAEPTAAENAAAANIAARLGYATTGLTMPVVVTTSQTSAEGPHIWIGKAAPTSVSSAVASLVGHLEAGEGGLFSVGDDLAIVGDDAGLAAAAGDYAARAPYEWKAPGEQLSAIANAVNEAGHGSGAQLVGLTYQKDEQGVHRAFIRASFAVTSQDLQRLFASHLAAVGELVVVGGASPVTVRNPKPLAKTRETPAEATPDAAPAEPGQAARAEKRLDLATLYTEHGLFNGTARMPIPSSSDAHLYVPAGASGVAMANLAARMGLETTGITLPIAFPAAEANVRQVRTQAVIAGDSALAQAVEKTLKEEDTAAIQALPALGPGEGEVRVVDDSFGQHGAILVRGDQAGSVAALDMLSGHFPNLWKPGKQYLSLEEIRYDLHRFFSLRSSAGQAAAAVYTLNQWLEQIKQSGGRPSTVKTEIYVDLADPGLTDFVRRQVEEQLGVPNAEVITESLHAGTRCCDQTPDLHFHGPDYPFHQAQPTFAEDLTIPWEGTRLLKAVQEAAPKAKGSQEVRVVARVSEGPEERQKLQAQLEDVLVKAGADRSHLHVEVLCAFKQGLSWLMDEVAPELAGKNVASIQIGFVKNVDSTGMRYMYSPARWVQEIYPVDELLGRKLNVPLAKITLQEFEPTPGGPTYRVRVLDVSGNEILSREFTATTAMQPYNGVFPRYEQVQVDTGWVRMDVGSQTVLNQRIKTDLEEFWDHYQNVTLPKVYQVVMEQAHGDMRPEFVPIFDTLKLDIHMSEPEYWFGLDRERLSTLEDLQEDIFYSTENFLEMWGDLETGRQFEYTGRIIPVVHPSEDGKDGHVKIEFYAKAARNPMVRLSWTDPQGNQQERQRDILVLNGNMTPRLIQADVKAGSDAVQNLTWLLPADYQKDDRADWIKLEGEEQVDRSILSVEKAEGELQWLDRMHAAGLYRDDIAYPHLGKMSMEFELPKKLDAPVNDPSERACFRWNISAPATPRPMISDFAGQVTGTPIVQWNKAISPAENAGILARFATYPGVTVYWMGRSYLGENIWAADIMQPSPSALRSVPKLTTLKAVILYSGRQHANEVSSTSHIDKLGEQLLTDPETRQMLRQVNVVLHPITNPDGAQMSVDLAAITPDNMLHPGYHGALAADEAAGETERDPLYPESRTRKQLIDAWLPDSYLNPHGYPSHEWVQPFSEYEAWVQDREGAGQGGGRTYWIPRGWYTSVSYLRDGEHPYSKDVVFAIRDLVVKNLREAPGLLDLENRMNARYARYGRFAPSYMTQPITGGIRIYTALKGSDGSAPLFGRGRGRLTSPDITWDTGGTEAPDETAHGDYMKLVAGAGLAFDKAHLEYLAQGKLRITRTEREVAGGVQWNVSRARPILPPAVERAEQAAGKDHQE